MIFGWCRSLHEITHCGTIETMVTWVVRPRKAPCRSENAMPVSDLPIGPAMSDEREFYVDDREFGDLAMNWEMAVKLCFSDEDYYERKAGEAHPEVRKQVLEW